MSLYETSLTARVERDSSSYLLQSPLAGRVVRSELRSGRAQSVHRGEVLIELDAAPEQLQLREAQARAATIAPEIDGLKQRLQAQERALLEERLVARSSAEEAGGRLEAARADERYAQAELARTQLLRERQLLTQRDLEKAQLDAERSVATAAMLGAAARRVPQEQSARERDRDARIAQLRAELAVRTAQRQTLAASIERLQYEIDRHLIRAPVDGVIAESAVLRAGAVVEAGSHLASIMSPGNLIVVAQFSPRAALGRIRAGQAALLRLDGMAWSEFGPVSATVAHVARELRDGAVRVELALDPRSQFRGRLEHGMPGSLEVTVERITPWRLLLRTVGQNLTAPR